MPLRTSLDTEAQEGDRRPAAYSVFFSLIAPSPGGNVLSLPQAHAVHTYLTKEDKGHGMLYLFGHLSKVADKPQDGVPDQGVPNAAEVHFVSIEVRVEGVHCLHRGWPLLLEPKNEVDPVVEVGTDKVTFQSLEAKTNEHENTGTSEARMPIPQSKGSNAGRWLSQEMRHSSLHLAGS